MHNNNITNIPIVSSHQKRFVIAPQTFAESLKFSEMIASSSFCPSSMKGKPADIMLAMQMGQEVGLSPMQALQNIAVINGKPCLYGDGALAVAMSSPSYVSHREWLEGSIKDNNLIAYCGVTRKNSSEYIKSFSMEDAKKAGLWSKAGVWQQYPTRMLQMRARAFAIRDKFADALRGINIFEEVQDYQAPTFVEEVTDEDSCIEDLKDCNTMEDLQEVYEKHYKYFAQLRDKDALKLLIEAKDKKKEEILEKEEALKVLKNKEALVQEFLEEMDNAETL